jgi:hypothetical protein
MMEQVLSIPFLRAILGPAMKLLLLPFLRTAEAQEFGEKETEFRELLQAFGELKIYLGIIAVVTFVLHVVFYPPYATKHLMQSYKTKNLLVQGKAKTVTVVSGTTTSQRANNDKSDDTSTSTSASPSASCWAEIVYEAPEHRYADNPSMKFRFPTAIDRKHFSIQVSYPRLLTKGESVEILLGDRNWPRTGYPTELVDQYLTDYALAEAKDFIVRGLLVFGVAVDIMVVGFTMEKVYRMANDDDEESEYEYEIPSSAYLAFIIGLCVIEAVSLLVALDRFLKQKRKRYGSAKRVGNPSTEMQTLMEEATDN